MPRKSAQTAIEQVATEQTAAKQTGSTESVVKYQAQARYDEKNTVKVTSKLNRKTDADIVAFLEGKTNMSGLVKDALRALMREQGFIYHEAE